MKLLDLNLLVYAINDGTPRHDRARRWLSATLSGDEPVALPWVVVLGFLRLVTSPRVLPRPLSPNQALAVVEGWLARPCVRLLNPGEEHWRHLRDLVAETGTGGNLTTDAHLAALAIEHGCELCSTDNDFGRFPRLRWMNPLAS